MSYLDEVGEHDGWRCWLCDEPVDRNMPSRDSRGASVDTRITKARARKMKKDRISPPSDRLAHVGCNTGKGAVDPVAAWLVDRLSRLHPGLAVSSRIDNAGGQYLVSLFELR